MERTAKVQSVDRALELIDSLEHAGGALSVRELSVRTALPVGTVHRLLQTLVARGYLGQLPDRRYCLGSRLAVLGASAGVFTGARAQPVLRQLAHALRETTNLAVLSSGSAEYIAQVAGTHSMRMFTEVGHRVPLHSTGVGKALLSTLADDEVARLLRRTGMPAYTPATITSPDRMLAEVANVRARGYAIDEGETEVGVRCVAVPFRAGPSLAISVSGPEQRMTDEIIARAAVALRQASVQLVHELEDGPGATPG